MPWEVDPAKDRRNIRDHGISLTRIEDMDPDSMLIRPDLREEYGEERFRILGFIDNRLYDAAVTFTPLRVFSLRPATRREREEYRHAFSQTPRR